MSDTEPTYAPHEPGQTFTGMPELAIPVQQSVGSEALTYGRHASGHEAANDEYVGRHAMDSASTDAHAVETSSDQNPFARTTVTESLGGKTTHIDTSHGPMALEGDEPRTFDVSRGQPVEDAAPRYAGSVDPAQLPSNKRVVLHTEDLRRASAELDYLNGTTNTYDKQPARVAEQAQDAVDSHDDHPHDEPPQNKPLVDLKVVAREPAEVALIPSEPAVTPVERPAQTLEMLRPVELAQTGQLDKVDAALFEQMVDTGVSHVDVARALVDAAHAEIIAPDPAEKHLPATPEEKRDANALVLPKIYDASQNGNGVPPEIHAILAEQQSDQAAQANRQRAGVAGAIRSGVARIRGLLGDKARAPRIA